MPDYIEADALAGLWSFLSYFWTGLLAVLKWVLDALVFIAIALFKLTLMGILLVVKGVILGLSLGNIAVNLAASWGYLDSNIAYLITHSGVTEGLAMISIAYGIRFTLNLIPAAFTRI